MKNIYKKLCLVMLLVFSVNIMAFSAEKEPEEMTLLELNKTVLTLKYEIYQIDHRFGEFEEMNGLKLKFERAKREKKLKKYEPFLEKRNAENTEKAKEAAEQAAKELAPKFKSLAEKSKEYGKQAVDAVTDFFGTVKDKAEESGFIDSLKEMLN